MAQYTVYLDHSVNFNKKGLLVVQINYVKQYYLKYLVFIVTKISGLDVTFASMCVALSVYVESWDLSVTLDTVIVEVTVCIW